MNLNIIIILQSIIIITSGSFFGYSTKQSNEQQEWELQSQQLKKDLEDLLKTGLVDTHPNIKDITDHWVELAQKLSQKTEEDIGQTNVNVGKFNRYVLEMIPGFTSAEHIMRCFVYFTLDRTFRLILAEKEETTKRELIIHSSHILMENAIDPLTMTFKLFEFALKYNNITSEKLSLMVNNVQRLKTVARLAQKALKTAKSITDQNQNKVESN